MAKGNLNGSRAGWAYTCFQGEPKIQCLILCYHWFGILVVPPFVVLPRCPLFSFFYYTAVEFIIKFQSWTCFILIILAWFLFLNFSKLISSLKAQTWNILKNYIYNQIFFTQQHKFLKIFPSKMVFTQIPRRSLLLLVKKQYPNQDTIRGSVISVTSLNDGRVSSSSLLTTTAIFKKDLQYKLLFSRV